MSIGQWFAVRTLGMMTPFVMMLSHHIREAADGQRQPWLRGAVFEPFDDEHFLFRYPNADERSSPADAGFWRLGEDYPGSPEDFASEAFTIMHEFGHAISFALPRPTTRRIGVAATRIRHLLRDPGNNSAKVWSEFSALNGEYMAAVAAFKPFDEIRATVLALVYVPEALDKIPGFSELEAWDPLWPIMRQIAEVTNSDWLRIVRVTLAAELTNPVDPLAGLGTVHAELTRSESAGWDPASWDEWWAPFGKQIGRKPGMPKVPFILFGDGSGGAMPSAADLHVSDDACVHVIRVLEGIDDKVFFESLRQQLSTGVGLSCPTAEPGACCGRGGQLTGVWSALPVHVRRRMVKPPATCIQATTRPVLRDDGA